MGYAAIARCFSRHSCSALPARTFHAPIIFTLSKKGANICAGLTSPHHIPAQPIPFDRPSADSQNGLNGRGRRPGGGFRSRNNPLFHASPPIGDSRVASFACAFSRSATLDEFMANLSHFTARQDGPSDRPILLFWTSLGQSFVIQCRQLPHSFCILEICWRRSRFCCCLSAQPPSLAAQSHISWPSLEMVSGSFGASIMDSP